MRLLALLVLLPLSAFGHTVLIVPEDDEARSLMEGLVEQLTKAEAQPKMAGGRSPAIACLKEKDVKKKDACLLESAGKANVEGVLLVRVTQWKGLYEANFTLTEVATKGKAFNEAFKAPKAKWAKFSVPVVKRLTVAIAKLKKVEGAPEPVAVKPEPPKPEPEPVKPEPVKPEPPKPEPVVVAKVEPTPATDTPVAHSLTPTPKPASARKDFMAEAPKSTTAAWAVSGVAVVAAATAGTFAVLGNGARTELEQTNNGFANMSYRDAQAKQATANTDFTIAAAAGIGAALAAGAAAWLWSSN